jgi:hypothetical protein
MYPPLCLLSFDVPPSLCQVLFMCYHVARFVGSPTSWDFDHFDEYHSVPAHW